MQKSHCNKIGGIINIPFFLSLIFAYQKFQSLGSKLHLCAAAWLRGCSMLGSRCRSHHFCASPHSPRSPLRVYYPPTVLVWYQRYLQFLPPPKANHINPLKDTCFIEACLFPLLRSLEVRLNVIKEWIHLTDWDYIHGKIPSEEPA